MKIFLRIHGKFMIAVIIPLILISGSVIMYVTINNRKIALEDALELADVSARGYANRVKAELDYEVAVMQSVNFLMDDFLLKPFSEVEKIFSDFINSILNRESHFLAIWMSWEIKAINRDYTKDYGRIRFSFVKQNEEIEHISDTLDLDGVDTLGLYYKYKQYNKPTITNPYWDDTFSEEFIQMATISIPVHDKHGAFCAFAGGDITMERFSLMIDNIHPFNGYAFLLSNDGTIIAHPDRELIGKSFYDENHQVEERIKISGKVTGGESFNFITNITWDGSDKYVSFAPVNIAQIDKPWSLGIVVPIKQITERADHNFIVSLIIGILGIFIIAVFVWILSGYFTRPLIKTTTVLNKLSTGNISDIKPIPVKSLDEIGQMSQALNTLTTNLRKIAGFAIKIGEGYLKTRYKPLSDNDLLGNALIKMQSDLVTTNEKLAESIKKAIAATNAKSLFLANMSHEIRTPLNGIIGMTDVLKESGLKKEQIDYLNIIEMSGNNLLTIINDILDFSKIESGQIELENIELNLRNEITQIINLLDNKARRKGISLNTKIDKQIPEALKGDPVRIKQILINLVNNGIKFTPKGSVTLNVSFIKSEKSMVSLLFSVTDSGIGISEKGLTRLFQSFSQTDISTTREYGGTGLGLAISKRLVELMNGEIGVESEVGKGSRFWFTVKLEADTTANKESVPSPDSKGIPEPKKLSVLLAEDNVINLKVASLVLNKLGHDIEIAENGKVAVEKFSEKKFDVILMDIQMPLMDGIEATMEIRKIESMSKSKIRIPIIAVTANAIKGDRERFLEAGMDNYIPKPFRFDEIEEILQTTVASVINKQPKNI